ncbi:MAG: GNAT family N-acetyltransferase [Pseudomonadota bacterium]
MADGSVEQTARTISSVREVGREAWDACALAAAPYNPFVSFDFLDAIEQSKSVCPEAGWQPMHLVLEEQGEIKGVCPLYAKGHSQGEYIFDHHWADAYARAGGRYYPKLLCAAPFTPANGPRLLAPEGPIRNTLAAALAQVCAQMTASSVHVNFVNDADKKALSSAGFLERTGIQYHWFNKGYETFDDFLGALASRKRKAVKRERRDAVESGIKIKKLIGEEIEERHWNAFWIFYQDTGARKWGTPYLTRTFFRLAAQTMGEKILMIVAERDGEPIAGALNFIGADTLYGRYWGCTEHHPFLHFEVCYHQAIEFAIERSLHCVEAGAQGEHKIARGYEPVATHSSHWIMDPGFRDAIARYLEAERQQGEEEIDILSQYAPFKKC